MGSLKNKSKERSKHVIFRKMFFAVEENKHLIPQCNSNTHHVKTMSLPSSEILSM